MLRLLCSHNLSSLLRSFFFFNDTATTEIYTLSLHDALPISGGRPWSSCRPTPYCGGSVVASVSTGRGSPTGLGWAVRLSEIGRAHVWNSSHSQISYAVFCLKKKKIRTHATDRATLPPHRHLT